MEEIKVQVIKPKKDVVGQFPGHIRKAQGMCLLPSVHQGRGAEGILPQSDQVLHGPHQIPQGMEERRNLCR